MKTLGPVVFFAVGMDGWVNEGFVSSSCIEYRPRRHLSFESIFYYNTYESLTDCLSS